MKPYKALKPLERHFGLGFRVGFRETLDPEPKTPEKQPARLGDSVKKLASLLLRRPSCRSVCLIKAHLLLVTV